MNVPYLSSRVSLSRTYGTKPVLSGRRKGRSVVLVSVLAAGAFTLWGQPASASSGTWLNTGNTSSTWSVGNNWVSSTIPGNTTSGATASTDVATFNTAVGSNGYGGTTGVGIAIGTTGRTIGGITFTAAAGNYFIGSTGGSTALYLSTTGTIQIASTLTSTNATETIQGPLLIAGSGTYTFTNSSTNGTGANAGVLKFTNSISGSTASSNVVLALNGSNANQNQISGNISNGSATTLSVTENGTGNWYLSGANTYTGTTSVTSGSLYVIGGSITGSNVSISGTGFFDETAGSIAGTGISFTDSSTTAVILNGANTYTGSTTISAGGLTLSGSLFGSNVGVSNSATFSETSAGKIGGANSFTDSSTGTVALAGTNTYTGATSVSAGTMALTGTLGVSGSTGSNIATSSTGVFNEGSTGVINGTTVTFTQGSTGTSVLSGANTYGGGTSVNAGGLIVTNGSALGGSTGGAVNIAAGTSLQYEAASDAQLVMHSTLGIATGSTGATLGTSIGSNTTTSEIAVTGAVTVTGTGSVTVNVYGEPTVAPVSGTYTLATAGSGSWGTDALGIVYNNTNFTVTPGSFSSSGSTITLGINSQTALTSVYWNGAFAGTSSAWSASDGSATSNWASSASGGAQALVPGSTATVYFSANTVNNAPTSTTLGQNMTINNLVFQDTVNAVNVNADGYTLTLNATSGNGITMNTGAQAVTFNANVVLAATQTWTNNSTNDLTVGGAISGTTTSSLITAGTGTIVLTGTNSYTGTTTINSGSTLQIGNGGTAGSIVSSGSITDNGTLAFDLSSTINQSVVSPAKIISGSGNIVQLGSGTLNLNEANTFTGGVNVLSGTVDLANATGAGTGTITLGNGSTANAAVAASSGTYANTIATAAGSTGLLEILDNSSRPVYTGAIIIAGGTTLTFAPSGQVLTDTGTISGSGNLSLAIDNLANGVTLTGATINLNNTGTIVTSNGSIPAVSGSILITGNISNVAGITQASEGGLILAGVNTYTGDTTVNSGTLNLTSLTAGTSASTTAAQDSVVNLNGGAVTFGSATGTVVTSAVLGGLGGSGNLNLDNTAASPGAVNLTIGNSNTSNGSLTSPNTLNPTYSGILSNTSGSASVTKVGTDAQTFTGANTYSGGTTISGGILYANNSSGSATGSGAVNVTSGGTFAGSGSVGPTTSSTGTAVTGAAGGNITPGGVQPAPNYDYTQNGGNGPSVAGNGSLMLNATNVNPSATLLSVGVGSVANPSLTFALGQTVTPSGLGYNVTQSDSEIIVSSTGGVANTVNFNVGGSGSTNSVVAINDLVGASLQLNLAYVLVQGSNTTFEDNGSAWSLTGGTGLTAFSGTAANLGGDTLFQITNGLSLLPGSSGNFFAGYYGGSVLLYDATTDSIDVVVVPEPGTWALMLGGLAMLVFWQRRRASR
jgi:fibronectin-binding autotransporter adhesin